MPLPHTLRAVDRDSEVLAALKVLSEFDADLTHECTRAINRMRSLVPELFIKYSEPIGLRAAGRSNVLRWAGNHSRKDPVNLIDAVF